MTPRVFLSLIGLGLVLFAPAARAGVSAPLSGDGAFSFSVDMPVMPTERGARVDLAVMVYHPQIHFQGAAEGVQHAELLMSVKLARQGRVALDSTQIYRLSTPDLASSQRPTAFQLLEMSFPAETGKWAVTVELRDLIHEASTLSEGQVLARAEGVLSVPDFLGERPYLSDPEFRLRGVGGSSLPNPERLYGITQDTLEAYVELRGAEPGESYVIEAIVTDPLYGGMDSQILTLRPESAHAATLYRLPLATFPESSYVLSLRPRWRPELAVDAEFSVSWRMDRVVQGGRDLRLEALLVLDPDEHDRFLRLSRPSQIQMLQDFWDRIDPTPGTDRNETYDRFKQRLEYCHRHYRTIEQPGPLSDRGRIYMRYGPPARIQVEVVPLNRDDLEIAIGRVHDTYQLDRDGTFAKSFNPLMMTDREATALDQRRNRASSGQEGAFELWEYDFQGQPLLGEVASWSENIDLRFLFVDRQGSGLYRLEFTNLPVTN